MADLYNSYSSAGDPGGGRDATKFYAFDAKSFADAINVNTHAQTFAPDTFANRPAAATGNTGALYFCTDNDTVYRSTGSAWVKVRIGADASSAMGDVPTSGWTAVNMQTGALWATDKDAMLFTIPAANGGAANFQYQYRTYPTPPFTLTTYLDAAHIAATEVAWSSCGIIISDGTKLITLGPQANANGTGSSAIGWNVWGGKYSNATTFSAVYGNWPINRFGGLPKWYRFGDDNTNITWSCSLNGIDWIKVGSEPRATFLTPTRIGVGGTNGADVNLLMRVRSWNGVA